MADKKIRVGVIGGGGIAQIMHLPHLAERPDRWKITALADVDPRTLEEVGTIFNVTRERVRQIETKALNKLRHPTRRKQLIEFME